MAATFELKKSGEQYMFNFKGANGEKVLTSERYVSKAGAQAGIASVKVNAPNDARYERNTSISNQPYFILKGANGETLGTSEMYSSTAARETGIASVKNNAPGAPTLDLT